VVSVAWQLNYQIKNAEETNTNTDQFKWTNTVSPTSQPGHHAGWMVYGQETILGLPLDIVFRFIIEYI
jgi:hypothetical protein